MASLTMSLRVAWSYLRIDGQLSELRNMTNCSSESFKQALDTFLKTIPDEPQTPGNTYMRRAESNSLIHMTPLTTARHPSISEELDTHGHLGTEPGPETIDKYLRTLFLCKALETLHIFQSTTHPYLNTENLQCVKIPGKLKLGGMTKQKHWETKARWHDKTKTLGN